MLITEKIAAMIEQMLEEAGGTAEIRRNDFAGRIGCVPSQINYVISSRFSPQHGYIVESRRGGGGYIKITRVRMDTSTLLMHVFASVGEILSENEVRSYLAVLLQNEIISPEDVKIYAAMMSDNSLSAIERRELRDAVRADMFKTLVLNLI